MTKKTWIEVRVLVPARMQEEAGLFLTDFSGRGVIIEEENVPAGGVVIRAFFRPEELAPGSSRSCRTISSASGSYELYPLGLEVRQVAEEDWAEAWKAHFKPLKVTDRLVIRPPWEDYAAGPGETVITIYPGMAFGTGRHATTLLCLQGPGAGVGGAARPGSPAAPGRFWTWAPAPASWPWPRPAAGSRGAGHRRGPRGRGRGPGKRASERPGRPGVGGGARRSTPCGSNSP